MLLGALIGIGYPESELLGTIQKLGFPPSIVRVEKVMIKGISSILVTVDNPPDQPCRHLQDIVSIIDDSDLKDAVKIKAKQTFKKLAKAEAKVHGVSIQEIHFHEVGAVDAIVDIVGVCAAIDYLGIETITCSPLPLGHGTVKCAHGVLPVPVPAVVELIKGVPTYQSGREGEHVTPTGAALVTTLANSFGPLGPMKIEDFAFGAGTRTFEGGPPNLLRAIIGQAKEKSLGIDELVIETNIDDMNPEFYGPLSEKLFEAGALDVTLTPCYMKKGRPGILVTVIGGHNTLEKISAVLFSESTTIGIRTYPVSRIVCDRKMQEVQTEFGTVRMKISRYNDSVVGTKPEFEDCKKLAKESDVSVNEVYNAALFAYKNKNWK